MTQGQELLAYKCICGFIHTDKDIFNKHLLFEGRKEKGAHKSEGRVNTVTGEIIMPPFDQRNSEQLKATRFAMKKKNADNPGTAIRQTEIIQSALQVKFVPRVIVCDLTPIMVAFRALVITEFGWPSDWPLDKLLDTALLSWCQDRDISLASYVIHNRPEHEAIRAQNLAENIEEPAVA